MPTDVRLDPRGVHHLPLCEATIAQMQTWYDQGIPIRRILIGFEIARCTFFRHVKTNRRVIPVYTEEQEAFICEKYKSGWGRDQFTAAGFSWRPVKRVLSKNEIPLRPSRRYPHKEPHNG